MSAIVVKLERRQGGYTVNGPRIDPFELRRDEDGRWWAVPFGANTSEVTDIFKLALAIELEMSK
jgi:hypothetical protein